MLLAGSTRMAMDTFLKGIGPHMTTEKPQPRY